MVIEVHADTTAFTQQVRSAVAGVGGMATVPVGSPVGATMPAGVPGVPAGATGAVAATQTAVAAAMAQAQTAAAQYAMAQGASSPNWSAIMQNAMTSAMYPIGASSPNWSMLMGQRGRAGTTPAAARGGMSIGGLNMMTLFNAGFGLMEAGGAASAIRNAEAMAGFANTREEANLLRAEAVEAGAGGFFGSLIFGVPNALGIEGSPAQVAQQARQQVAVRRAQDEIRNRRLDVFDSGAARAAYTFGGQTAATAARAEATSARQIADLERRAAELTSRLGERETRTRTYSTGTGAAGGVTQAWDEFAVTGEARGVMQADLRTVNLELGNAREQARFDARRRAEDIADSRRGVLTATQRANLIASGASARDVARMDLGAAGFDRTIGAFRQRGFAGALEEVGRTAAEARAQEFSFRRQDELDEARSRSAILADTYRAQGSGLQADLVDMQAEAEFAAGREGIEPAEAARIRRQAASRRGLRVAAENRNFASTVRNLTTNNAVLAAQFANNPLGAQIAAIRGQTEDARQSVMGDGFFQDIQRGLISAGGAMQEQLATRNFNRATSDINRSLTGAIERANLAIGGGPTRFIRQQISSILESADLDVRGLEDQGRFAEAGRRRDLGRLQMRGAEADFYRSFSYQEANPRGVVGSGNLSGLRSAIADAEKAVGETGRGEGKGLTSQQAAELLSIGKDILNAIREGIVGTAG